MNVLSFATELAAVEAAFAEPVRIPAIGDFANSIATTCADAELSETVFRECAAEYAHEEFCPSVYPGVSRFAAWLDDQETLDATDAEQFNHFALDHFEEIANRTEREVRRLRMGDRE